MVSDDVYRIAIVGVGPRGFGCLERLVIELARTPERRPVEITLHDPAAHPGAGPIYDPHQPDELLMNLAARHVTAWSADATDLAVGTHQDLLSWLRRHHPRWATGHAYVPRRLVGAYLDDVYRVLLGSLPTGVRVTPVRAAVTDLRRVEGGWLVRHGDPGIDRFVNEVVCTVGHGVWPAARAVDGSASLVAGNATPLVMQPYPVARALTPVRVPPGAVVAVRGFALSFIDVALHLTIGRGGAIAGVEGFGEAGTPWPVYTPGDADVACLVPWSRTGAPLLAKPGPGLAAASAELEADWAALRAALRGVGSAEPVTEIVRMLTRAAVVALDRVGVRVDRRTRAGISALLDPDPIHADHHDRHDGPAALAAMRRSVEVALGRRPPDASWAVGEVWRQGYPGLVHRIGHGGLPGRCRPRFVVLARRLERVAFGPPPENVLRLVALADAGTLDLSYLPGASVAAERGQRVLTAATGTRPVDVVVDSVLTPPGADQQTPLWSALLRRGMARLAAGTSGIEVTRDASCIGRDGRATPGLAAIGRATEGWVLGNDTLNRTLHGETVAWARRIVEHLGNEHAIAPDETARRAAPTLGVPT